MIVSVHYAYFIEYSGLEFFRATVKQTAQINSTLSPPQSFVSFVAFIISLLLYLLQFCGNISLSKKSRKFVFERFDKVKLPPTIRAFALLHSELWNYGLPRTMYSSFICCDEGLAVETSAP